jgi:phage I-like protein
MRLARALISTGHVDIEMAWPTAGEDLQHGLGIRTGVDREDAASTVYPFVFGGKVSRSALLRIRAESAADGQAMVHSAVGELLSAIDQGKDSQPSRRDLLQALDCGAMSVELDASIWDSTAEVIVQLLPFGDVVGLDGRQLKVTPWSLESIVNRFDQRENQLLLDYDHSTIYAYGDPLSSLAAGWVFELYGIAPVEGGTAVDLAAVAAAHGAKVADKVEEGGAGVYARVRLTEAAAERVRGLEYRYLSPVVDWVGSDHEVSEVVMASLTNDPNIDGMLPIAASRAPDAHAGTSDAQRAIVDVDENTEHREPESEKGEREMPDVNWAELAKAAGVSDYASVTSEAEYRVALSQMRADAEARERENAELRAHAAAAEADRIVGEAIENRLIPEDQKSFFVSLCAEDRARFDAFMSTAKPLPEAPKPPQSRDTKAADDSGSKLPATVTMFTMSKRLHVGDEALTEANQFLDKAIQRHGGNTADALRAMSRRQVLG